MTHRFHGDRTQTRKGGRYDRRHHVARAEAAKRHSPADLCARCGQPLGPISSALHYDHDERGGYLGFSHAACNLRAGARKGNRLQAAALGHPTRPTRRATSYPIQATNTDIPGGYPHTTPR